MKIQFNRYFLITMLALGAHTGLHGNQIRTTIKALEDLHGQLINLQSVSDQMKSSLNGMSGLITRLQSSSRPGVITRPVHTAPVRDADIENRISTLFRAIKTQLGYVQTRSEADSADQFYLPTLEAELNDGTSGFTQQLQELLPQATRKEVDKLRTTITDFRGAITDIAAKNGAANTYYTALPEENVQSSNSLVNKINTFFASGSSLTPLSVYEDVKTTITTLNGANLAEWRDNLSDLAKLHKFISFAIEDDALTEAATDTATKILGDVLPCISFRTAGLFLAFSLLANNYNEPSFVRWATGEVLWTIGQNPTQYYYEPLSRFVTYQLVNLVNSSSSSAVDEAILASIGDYKKEKETNRSSKPFSVFFGLSSSDEDIGIGFKVKNLDEEENKRLHYLEAKFTDKGRQVAAWLRTLIFAKTCLERLDTRSFELDLEEANQRQYEIDLAKKNDYEEQKGQDPITTNPDPETPNTTPVVDEKTMILIGTVLQKKPANNDTDLLQAITEAAAIDTPANSCYLKSISSSPSFETIADYTLNLKYGSLTEEIKAQTLSQATILVEKVLKNTQSLDMLLQKPILLDACLRLILATNATIDKVPDSYKPICYTYDAIQKSNALLDYFIITTPKTLPEISTSVCKLLQSTSEIGSRKKVIDLALTKFKELVDRNYFSATEKADLRDAIDAIRDSVTINLQHLTEIDTVLATT